ncbi:DUF4233 domain-containing protein [Micromonospora krabiensis]|uniref:DUF4233 domain-containing protein n=1 Tax=Micromonospora krabiensis TaxID=307121 RepID=A0A1C3NC28_9ACTN|nr:DUF4233 domain-containing protein [Micromonospora krabiensis]SBV30101.1 Protein of unknown function [Micromonospora krabiensis]
MTTPERPTPEQPASGSTLGAGPEQPPSASGPEPGGNPSEPPRRSGLRDPDRAVRGLGAGTLAIEALVLLLAIQPIRVVGGDLSGTAIGVVVALAVAAVVLAGMMRRSWTWHAGTVLQGLLILAGLLHWSLFVLGVIFALVWGYALHVRRVILG